jgi:hypothetical protein
MAQLLTAKVLSIMGEPAEMARSGLGKGGSKSRTWRRWSILKGLRRTEGL